MHITPVLCKTPIAPGTDPEILEGGHGGNSVNDGNGNGNRNGKGLSILQATINVHVYNLGVV